MSEWHHNIDIDDIWIGLININPYTKEFIENVANEIISINPELWDKVTKQYGERRRDIYLTYWCIIFSELLGWSDEIVEGIERICAIYFHILFLWRYLDDVIDNSIVDATAVDRYNNILINVISVLNREDNHSLYIDKIKKYSSIGIEVLSLEKQGNLNYNETWKRSALFLVMPDIFFDTERVSIFKEIINFLSLVHDTFDWPSDYKNSIETFPVHLLKSYSEDKLYLKKEVYSSFIKDITSIIDKKYSYVASILKPYGLTSFLVKSEYSEVRNLTLLLDKV